MQDYTLEYVAALKELYGAFKANPEVDVISIIANSDAALDLDEKEDALLTRKAQVLVELQRFAAWAEERGDKITFRWNSVDRSIRFGFFSAEAGRKWAVCVLESDFAFARVCPSALNPNNTGGKRAMARANDVVKTYEKAR